MTDPDNVDAAWKDAQAIWLAAGVTTPSKPEVVCAHYLTDLKRAAGMFREAIRINDLDDQRGQSMMDGAGLCHDLLEFLYSIDDVANHRITRTADPSFDPQMSEIIFNLIELEHVLRTAPEPPRVRKRKHDLNDFLIGRLADTYEQHSDRKATVTTDWNTSERRGVFVNFVMEFFRRLLPEYVDQVNPRSIQRALKRHRTS